MMPARLEPMDVSDFEEGRLYVVACLGVEGRSHSVVRYSGGTLVEECSGFPIGWHEVQAGLEIDDFFNSRPQVGDRIMVTIPGKPLRISLGWMHGEVNDCAFVALDGGDLHLVPIDQIERAEGIIDAI